MFCFKVVKYVCRALTAPTIYVWYCLMMRSSFDLRIISLMLMVLNILAYKQFSDKKDEVAKYAKAKDVIIGPKFGKGISVSVKPPEHDSAKDCHIRTKDIETGDCRTPVLGPSISPTHAASPAG